MCKRIFFLIFFAIMAISVFPQQDSLFDDWNKRLDAINFFIIDRLPIYRFTLSEVRNETKQYAASNDLDKEKLSDLYWKINYMSNILEQKLAHIDSLFFTRAVQFEYVNNEQEAVFYYKRSLDFNPSYCASIEKLSRIYAKNHQNEQHLELLQFVSLENRIQNCPPQLFNAAFDTLITQARDLITHYNYYDAVKILDTVKLFLHYIPQEKYAQTCTILLDSAQNGIYSSYYDIINEAIKVKNLPLAEEYLLGLRLAIEKNNQDAEQNFYYSKAVQNLRTAHEKKNK